MRLTLAFVTLISVAKAAAAERGEGGGVAPTASVATLIYLKRFGVGALWDVGFNEQIFRGDEHNLGRGQSD